MSKNINDKTKEIKDENEIKKYNQEIKTIKEDYSNFQDKVDNKCWSESYSGKFPELSKRITRADKNLQNVGRAELRLLQTSDEPDTNETSRSNWNKGVKESNDKVIELYKEAVAAMKAWVEKVEEPEKIKIEAKNNELKKIKEYNHQMEAHQKEYEKWSGELFKDGLFYKYGKRDGEDNKVLISPPDLAGFEEIEELVKKTEPLKSISPDSPNKNAKHEEFNEQQLKIRGEVIAKIKAFLDKNQQVAKEADKKAVDILNNLNNLNKDNKSENKKNNSSDLLFQFKNDAKGEIVKVATKSKVIFLSFGKSYNDLINEIDKAKNKKEVNEIKEKWLLDIEREARKKQTSNKLAEILFSSSKLIGKSSPEELKEHIRQIEQFNGRTSYQESINIIKVDKGIVASKLGIAEYTKILIEIINTRLNQFNLKPEELGSEIQQSLTNLSSETNFEKVNELEVKINQKINEIEATKKFKQIQDKVEHCSSEKELTELKKEIDDFITSDKVCYQQKVKENQQMLGRLKINASSQPQSPSPNNFPWKVAVPISLAGVLLIAISLVIRKRRINQKTK